MTISPISKGMVLLGIISTFFIICPPADAATLQLSAPLKYAGLTFFEPLQIIDASHALTHYLTLQFGRASKPNSLTIKSKTATKPPLLPTLPALTSSSTLLPTIELADSPTPTPTATPIPTDTPTPLLPSPIPSPTSQPSATIASMPANPTGGLNADKLFAMVNSYRQSKGLASFQTDERSCSLAASRAPEVGEEIADGHMHSGLKARNLPYWNSENIISYNSEEGAFNWWINDTIHREQIEGDYKYSCLACSGNSCAEEFTNFQAK